MIGRAGRIARGAVLLLVFAGLVALLALSRFTDDPFALLFESRQRAAIDVPGTRDRMVLTIVSRPLFNVRPVRTFGYERSGQRIYNAELYTGAEPGADIDVYYFPQSPDLDGPVFLLKEPEGEVLVDVRPFSPRPTISMEGPSFPRIYRVIRSDHGPFLTTVSERGRVAAVRPEQGGPWLVTEGLSFEAAGLDALVGAHGSALPTDSAPEAFLIGRFTGGSAGRPLRYDPVPSEQPGPEPGGL